VPILGELHGEIMVFEPLQVKELAVDGATIETAFPLPLNSLHDLRLTLGTNVVVVKARVVHSHVGEMGENAVRYGREWSSWSRPRMSGRPSPSFSRRSGSGNRRRLGGFRSLRRGRSGRLQRRGRGAQGNELVHEVPSAPRGPATRCSRHLRARWNS
jgi:hypothetical protein